MDLLGLYHCLLGQSRIRIPKSTTCDEARSGFGKLFRLFGCTLAMYSLGTCRTRMEKILGICRVDEVKEGCRICRSFHFLLIPGYASHPHFPNLALTITAWIRIIFCQAPRQVVNALTLYSVFRANLEPTTATDVGNALSQFF